MEEKNRSLTEAELAEAFKPSKKEKPSKPKDKKNIWSIIVLIIGIIALAVGITLFAIKQLSTSGLQDGEYLVSADNWILEDGTNCNELENEQANCLPGVIWKFTEIGKGTLTTNNHINDYDFIWAIEDSKLKIETKWLYDLENEYEYELDQKSGTLKLHDDESEYIFRANFATE